MTIIVNKQSDFTTEALYAAVNGHSHRLAPGPALALLAGRRDAGAGKMLEHFSQDHSKSDSFRAHALRLLAMLNPRGIEALSLRLLDDPAPTVVRAAARTLGRIGSQAALEPLQHTARCDGKHGREARLATLILASRLGIPGPPFEGQNCNITCFNPGDCGELAAIRNARRTDINAALTALADEPLYIEPDTSTPLLIIGLDFEWLLLVNQACATLLETPEAPALLAVLAEWDPSDDQWFEGFLLIAAPASESKQRTIALIDEAGDIVMKGEMTRCGEHWSFTLTTSIATMLHARIDGTLSGSHVEIGQMRYRLELTGRQKAAVLS